MPLRRSISINFWNDPYVEDLIKREGFEAAGFYVYLITNKHTSISGLYEITVRAMVFDTSLEEKRVKAFLGVLVSDGKIQYHGNLLWIKNFVKHQPTPNTNQWAHLRREVDTLTNSKDGLRKDYWDYIGRLGIGFPKSYSTLNNITLNKITIEGETLFSLWKGLCNHPTAGLTEKRVKKINTRLKEFSVDQLKDAIIACAESEYHMLNGYNWLERNIFVTKEKVEWWLDRKGKDYGKKNERPVPAYAD